MSEVLYRKYRPKNFTEVLGQEQVVKTLSSQVKLGTVSHAYLFIGGRGTGKTSIARIFANELGTDPNDIYEIDAASNTGVDDIRELTESVNTLPFNSKYKIYILDEAHMLSKSASNALLKTLEEPPSHIIFILATTESHKIPETILSRTEVYNFKKPTQEILKEVVINVSKKEGFSIGSDSADLLALLGDGSFRDTLGNLQKVLSISKDKKISYDEVLAVTGAPKISLVNDLVSSICFSDFEKSLLNLEKAKKENIDMSVLLKMVLEKLRGLMLYRFGGKDMLQNFSKNDLDLIEDISKNKSTNIDSKIISRLLEAYIQTEKAFIDSLPFELALVDLFSDKKI
jgi:DNA polymerase-3 subunit gamma/tau